MMVSGRVQKRQILPTQTSVTALRSADLVALVNWPIGVDVLIVGLDYIPAFDAERVVSPTLTLRRSDGAALCNRCYGWTRALFPSPRNYNLVCRLCLESEAIQEKS